MLLFRSTGVPCCRDLFAEEAERVPPFVINEVLAGFERRKHDRPELPQALDRLEPERQVLGQIVPADDEMPTLAQAAVAGRKCPLGLVPCIEAPADDAVEEDDVE
jgi:hypothetical protein